MKQKIDLSLFKDPNILWQQLSWDFKTNPQAKTQFSEELWIVSLFFCFYNRQFLRSLLIYRKHSDELDKNGIDVVVKERNGVLLEIQAKHFPTSSVLKIKKKYRGPVRIYINKDRSGQYLQSNNEEIEKLTVSYLKRKLRNDYDFVVIYLDTQFEECAWLKSVLEDTGLEKEQIRTKEVWAFKNEKITVSPQDKNKATYLHRYRFFRLFPVFENYNYEFQESPKN